MSICRRVACKHFSIMRPKEMKTRSYLDKWLGNDVVHSPSLSEKPTSTYHRCHDSSTFPTIAMSSLKYLSIEGKYSHLNHAPYLVDMSRMELSCEQETLELLKLLKVVYNAITLISSPLLCRTS